MSAARDALRAKLLQTRRPTSRVIDFFGENIEIRQPSLGDILKANEEQDRNAAIVNTLVNYACVPGTDEKIFEQADADQFLSMPFGGDFVRVSQVLEELTQINFLDGKRTTDSTQSNSVPTESAGSLASPSDNSES